jgi:hypothetical protein
MKHRILKFLLIIVLIFPLLISNLSTTYAEEATHTDYVPDYNALTEYLNKLEDQKKDAIPSLSLSSSPTQTVIGGKKTAIEIEIKNVTSYTAKNIFVQATLADTTNLPFSIEFPDSSNTISSISGNSTKTVTLILDVDPLAETKVYAINLDYAFSNTYDKSFTGKNVLYVKVDNAVNFPKVSLKDFKINPDEILPGSNINIAATLENMGLQNAYDIKITIDKLSTDTLTVNKVNSISYNQLNKGTQNTVNFSLVASKKIKPGNYPVTFKITYKDNLAKAYTNDQEFFINVGGSSGDTKTFLQIQNLTVPNKSYGVGENFSIHLDVVNTGKVTAKNIKVTANYGTEGCVVPKSPSVQLTDSLSANSTYGFDFTFAGTSTAKTQNYPIAFDIEYEDGSETSEGTAKVIKYTQYTGVNISNPNNVDDKDKDKAKSIPKIIISKYECNPIMVNAGDQFDLNMSFTNTHPNKTVNNIKIFLTVSAESKTGNVFIPVNSSNTFYVDSISPKQTVDRSVRLFAMPDAEAKTYNVTVNFDYEDETGALPAASEFIGISVKQPTKLETDDITPPTETFLGEPAYINFNFYNTGKVTLNNLMVKLTGDFDTQTASNYYGNFESGSSEYYEGSIIPTAIGKQTGKLIISYDTASGEHVEKVTNIELNVSEPMAMDAMSNKGNIGKEGMQAAKGMKQPKTSLIKSPILWISIVATIAVIIIIVLFIKHKKKQKGVDLDE